MARPHKFAGDRLTLATTLSLADLQQICDIAARESRGDHLRGKVKFEPHGWQGGAQMYLGRGILRNLVLSYVVSIEDKGGYRELTTEIDDYLTVQDRIFYFIPVGPKKMVGHFGYMQALGKIVTTVQQHDPTSWSHLQSPKRPGFPAARPAHLTGEGGSPEEAVVEAPSFAEAVAPAPFAVAPAPEPAVVPPAVSSPPPAVAEGLSEELMDTAERPLRAAEWTVAFEGQVPVPVRGVLVLGRNPQSVREHPDAVLFPVSGSDADQVSKTHAVLVPQGKLLFVSDQGSTNGVSIQRADGSIAPCEPFVLHPVNSGEIVLLGTYLVRIARIDHGGSGVSR